MFRKRSKPQAPRAVVQLGAAIEALRKELTASVAEGEGQPMRFQLDPIDLTLQVVVTKEVDGKVGWQVLELGSSYESAATQTVTLRLTPMWRTSEGDLVKDFAVASVTKAGMHFGPDKPADDGSGGD